MGFSSGGSAPVPVAPTTDAVLQNLWDVPVAGHAAGYYVDRGRLYLVGVLRGDAANAFTAFTLPAGFRPPNRIDPIIAVGYNAAGNQSQAVEVQINQDGTVNLFTPTGASMGGQATAHHIGLDHISFKL